MYKTNILKKLKNELIVSCQTSDGNPLHTDEHILLLVDASYKAGSRIFRIDSPTLVEKVKLKYKNTVVIGIHKLMYGNSDVFITPTMNEVSNLVKAGADIIAVQATEDLAPNGKPSYNIIEEIREKYPNTIIMADISTFDEAHIAKSLGADIISTTLHGYTKQSVSSTDHFDFEFLKKISKIQDCLIVAEGKIWNLDEALKALKTGADSIVIGTAINNPMLITKHFIEGINNGTK